MRPAHRLRCGQLLTLSDGTEVLILRVTALGRGKLEVETTLGTFVI